MALVPHLAALSGWLCAVFRLVTALLVAMTLYGLVLLVVMRLYPADLAFAGAVYSVALAGASLLATCAASLAAPARQQRLVVPVASGLALLLPVGLYAQAAIGGGWHATCALYVLGAVAGSLAATRLLAAMPTPELRRA